MSELNNFLTGIADAIRNKKGTTEKINASNFASEINSIESGGVVVVDELPTNPEAGVIYQVNEVSDIDILVKSREGWISHLELIMINLGLTPNITYYLVDSLPSTPLVSDLQTFNPTHIYICEDIPYLYGNAGYGNMWLPVIDLYNSMSQEDPLELKGYVGNESEMLEVGVYVTYKLGKQGLLNNEYHLLEYTGGWNNYKKIFDKTIVEYKNDKIKRIQPYSFNSCKKLENVDLPNVTIIGTLAFSACTSLVNISIPNVEILYQECFRNCYSLTTLSLPKVRDIAALSFYMCNNLREIYIGGDLVCNLGSVSAFNVTSDNLKIYVSDNLVDAYKTATNWSVYADKIHPISEYNGG